MEKRKITIPTGYRYLGTQTKDNVYGIEIKPGIYSKPTGIGFTTAAIMDEDHDTIILMPRIQLLKNKHAQHPETTQMVYGDVTNAEIDIYRASHRRQIYLCTYDSWKRLKNELGDEILRFKIIVDEFHLILSDCSFKVYTEMEMLRELEGLSQVTYVSATPHLDYFLEQMPEFQDLPYYEIEWEDAEKVMIQRQMCKQPVDAAIKIIREYMKGIFPFKVIDGKRVDAREAYIFLNSVNNIVNIVHQTGIPPEQVNIICADTYENRKVIQKIGEGYDIGYIPLRGEPNKMITLCTSTCYFGVDFYSDCAQVFIISDCHRSNTSVSISTEIPQIVGRIRNANNPFRNEVFFIYNTWNGQKDESKLMARLEAKHQYSIREIEYFNRAPKEIRPHLIKMMKREKTICKDEDSFCYYDEKNDTFALNNMSILSEEYEIRVQYSTYHYPMYVFRALEEREELNVSKDYTYLTLNEHLTNTILKTTFAEQMEQYCEYRKKQKEQKEVGFYFLTADMERRNEKLRNYYDALGPDRIKALGYKEKKLQEDIYAQKKEVLIHIRMNETFTRGMELKSDQIKKRMNEVYKELGVNRKGKVSDLQSLYGFKVTQHNRVGDNGVRYRSYEIIGNENLKLKKRI